MSCLADTLNAQLPQLQCERCGYAGCQPYAQALAAGAVSPDRCLPGGAATQQALAQLLGVPPGAPLPAASRAQYVRIDSARCIGCYLCQPRCPVDAIVGSLGQLHVVLAESCTGCGLCLPLCPVECIEIVERPLPLATQLQDNPPMQARAATAQTATLARQARLARENIAAPLSKKTMRTEIRAALARAQKKPKAGDEYPTDCPAL